MSGRGQTPDDLARERLRFREVNAETRPDFERLFESRGAPKYCWCMVWRDRPPGITGKTNAEKKAAITSIIERGTPVGIIGYIDGEPSAWCSVAPRSTYRRGLGGTEPDGEDAERVWSIACFFIPRRLRGQGIGRQLLSAAIEYAQERGAKLVEAYPVDPDSPSYLFMGFVPMFESAGFKQAGNAGSRRHVMRLELE